MDQFVYHLSGYSSNLIKIGQYSDLVWSKTWSPYPTFRPWTLYKLERSKVNKYINFVFHLSDFSPNFIKIEQYLDPIWSITGSWYPIIGPWTFDEGHWPKIARPVISDFIMCFGSKIHNDRIIFGEVIGLCHPLIKWLRPLCAGSCYSNVGSSYSKPSF